MPDVFEFRSEQLLLFIYTMKKKIVFNCQKKKTDTFSHGQTDRNSLEWKCGKTISKLITHGLQNIKPIE